jgi:hypothetical protein
MLHRVSLLIFQVTWRFIILFNLSHDWCLSSAIQIQYTPSDLIQDPFQYYSPHLGLGFPNDFFTPGILVKILCAFRIYEYKIYAAISHLPLLITIIIFGEGQVYVLIVHISPTWYN